jgi:hypothetical protein
MKNEQVGRLLRNSSFEIRNSKFKLLVVLLAACTASSQVPTPAALPPPPQLSTITIPIRASLAPLLPQLEAQVPKTVESQGYELDPQKRLAAKYRVARDPIRVNMIGAGLHVTTTVHYALEACPVIGGSIRNPCISCGYGEAMRNVVISLQSRLDWTAAWTLGSRTVARPLDFLDRCTVTFLGVDVTDWKLRPVVDAQLQDALRTVDANTPKLASFKREAQQVWSSLLAPIEIASRTWLVLEPQDIALAPLRGNGLEVTSAISLHALTRVVIGENPAASTKPLPSLRVAAANESGIRVPFVVAVPYAEASRIVNEQFAARTYNLGRGATLKIDSIQLSAGANGKTNMAASIDYRASRLKKYRGVVYLEGSPAIDPATMAVVVNDLDYAVDPRRHNPFLRIADHFAHDDVRDQLRANAKWPIAGSIAAMRADIERGITRNLAPNVTLRGKVDSIVPESVAATAEGYTIVAVAVGRAELRIEN